MNRSSRLNKVPYLALSIMLISIGIPGAYAFTITLDGEFIELLGILDMNNNKITNVGTPITPSDVATKAYVDSSSGSDTLATLECNVDQIAKWDGASWICSNLDLELEILDLNLNAINNLGNPIMPFDIATKAYVDSSPSTDTLASLNCNVNESPRWNGIQWECSGF